MIVRIYTGDDGQSHFEDIDMESGPYPWGELRDATGVIFNQVAAGIVQRLAQRPSQAVRHYAVRRDGGRHRRRNVADSSDLARSCWPTT